MSFDDDPLLLKNGLDDDSFLADEDFPGCDVDFGEGTELEAGSELDELDF